LLGVGFNIETGATNTDCGGSRVDIHG
jgi:hypothetical protein